jgi:hypothetical protein
VNANPSDSGWRAIGNTTVERGIASTEVPVPALSLSRGEGDSVLGAEIGLLGPVDGPSAVDVLATFFGGAAGSTVTVTLLDEEGIVTATVDITLAAPDSNGITANFLWINQVAGRNYTLRIEGDLAEVAVLFPGVSAHVEEGWFSFSGSFSDDPGTDTYYQYVEDGVVTSASRRSVGPQVAHTLTALAPDTVYGDIVASFSLRSSTMADLTAELISLDDGTVLSTREITTEFSWTRYSLGAHYGRNVKLVISGTGRYDIDQVLIEGSASLWDYFDGDTPAAPEYETTWLAQPNNSYSRTAWIGEAKITDVDSQWRSFLSVRQGTLKNIMFSAGDSDRISVEEQLYPYERYYHDVKAIEGPTVLKRYPNEMLDIGSAIEVDFLLVAETPSAFSNGREIDTLFPVYGFFSDPVDVERNEFTNPATWNDATGFAALGSGSVALTWEATGGPTGDSFVRVTAQETMDYFGVAAGQTVSQLPVVGGEVYVFSAYMESSTSFGITQVIEWFNATGDSLRVDTMLPTDPLPTWTRCSTWALAAPDDAARASIEFFVNAMSEGGTIASGDTIDIGFVMASNRARLSDFFFGYTPDTDEYTYAWAGAENASASTKTVVPVPESALIDPDCGPIPVAPRPPVVPEMCIDSPVNWRRYWVEIPAEDVALWASTVPTITLNTRDGAERQVRVRFHPNPFGYPVDVVDPLGYCGEFILSYLPANTILTVNGMNESAFAQVAGGEPLAADHLLYGTDGTPMEWPELSCGVPYVVTIDVPTNESLDNLAIELTVNRKE